MHPFDYASESRSQQSVVHHGASQPSMSRGASSSQQSEAGAALVCDRILHGWVDLSFAPWPAMTDGESRRV